MPVRKTYHIQVADNTGPLDFLKGRKVLLLEDAENLTHSAADLGLRVCHRSLAQKIRASARSCQMHAFFTHTPGEARHADYSRNWIVHTRGIETVKTVNGIKRLSNSDNMILFYAGLLSSRSDADVIIIATGDGSLACDIAYALSKLPKKRVIATMSLAGSTSHRINSEVNPHITENIEIGMDCLFPIERRSVAWKS